MNRKACKLFSGMFAALGYLGWRDRFHEPQGVPASSATVGQDLQPLGAGADPSQPTDADQ